MVDFVIKSYYAHKDKENEVFLVVFMQRKQSEKGFFLVDFHVEEICVKKVCSAKEKKGFFFEFHTEKGHSTKEKKGFSWSTFTQRKSIHRRVAPRTMPFLYLQGFFQRVR